MNDEAIAIGIMSHALSSIQHSNSALTNTHSTVYYIESASASSIIELLVVITVTSTLLLTLLMQPQAQKTVIYQKDKSTNHLLHFIICLFCPWWIIVWLCVCCIDGC